jgi:hypothetical protein
MVVAQRQQHLMECLMNLIQTMFRTGLAAVAVVCLSNVSRDLDTVLPLLAQRVQNRLISLRPDLHAEISAAVQEVALGLAVRRADLDSAIALAWARIFSEEELRSIADFFASPAGQKFIDVNPELSSVTIQTVENWSTRVGSELLEKSREELKKQGHEL